MEKFEDNSNMVIYVVQVIKMKKKKKKSLTCLYVMQYAKFIFLLFFSIIFSVSQLDPAGWVPKCS